MLLSVGQLLKEEVIIPTCGAQDKNKKTKKQKIKKKIKKVTYLEGVLLHRKIPKFKTLSYPL